MNDKKPNENKFLLVYKGKCFTKNYIKKYQKIIVIDLDETLGSFGDLYILWSGINKIRKVVLEKEQDEFNELLDLYPEFLRYGILNILDFLYLKKMQGECDKIYLYTNNNCTPPWVSLIISYFNYKLKIKTDLFDKMICAFKINNKKLELSRTTNDKTHNDLIKCTLLPRSTEICFVDNTYYSEMINEKVYYIQPRGYFHNMNTKDIIQRFLISTVCKRLVHIFDNKNDAVCDFIHDWFELNGSMITNSVKTHEIDVFVAHKMMYHIKEFFYLTQRKNKTKKNRNKLVRFTRKSLATSSISTAPSPSISTAPRSSHNPSS